MEKLAEVGCGKSEKQESCGKGEKGLINHCFTAPPQFHKSCEIERKEKEILFHTMSKLWNLLLVWEQAWMQEYNFPVRRTQKSIDWGKVGMSVPRSKMQVFPFLNCSLVLFSNGHCYKHVTNSLICCGCPCVSACGLSCSVTENTFENLELPK